MAKGPWKPRRDEIKPNAQANAFRCPRCSKRFSTSGQLTRHWLITGHSKPRGT